AATLDARGDTLDEIDGARHGAQVHAFPGRALLDIGADALHGFGAILPRAWAVRSRKYPGMDHAGQGRAVRRATVVVVDVARYRLGCQVVSEAAEELAKLVGGKDVEQHENVGLLRRLVSIGAVVLRFEYELQALYVAVAHAVTLPVELLQPLVAFELADDAVTMERQVHSATHVVPVRRFGCSQLQPLCQFGPTQV